MENLGNFTMPQLVIKNLQSENETEMVIISTPLLHLGEFHLHHQHH